MGITYLVVGTAVFIASWASILIRWCGETSALVISFYRLFWAALLIFLIAVRNERRSMVAIQALRKKLGLIPLAGLMLALHFVTWISSLKYTTIAQSLVLESTHPVFALFLAPLFLKERITIRAAVAVLTTLIGVTLIGGLDFHITKRYFVGDMLALASAFFVTLYLFIARYLRQAIPLSIYLTVVYATAALAILPLVLLNDLPLVAYPPQVHFYLFLLALGPTGLGHSLLNWAARRIPVYRINLFMLGELLGASLLAYVFFQEIPASSFFWGAPFIIAGIVLAVTEPLSQEP